MEAKQSIIASSASCGENRPPSLSPHSPSPPALCRKAVDGSDYKIKCRTKVTMFRVFCSST
ncbi:hypothetical protein CCACVL1_25044 [Corchorus capsularis]|uniref:Uncharacterized protein n=1 Tax=Corchorus capsularis TaxID=210143 RepID=A0A1R3GM18_COCAP|nr:hypothetical protein CCACVL1_25044 [Corchorus capsularis]